MPTLTYLPILLSIAGWTASPYDAPPPAGGATARPAGRIDPVFDCYRLNYAWGFSLAGAMVDRDGTVRRYRMRERDRSPAPALDGAAVYFPADELRAKFAEAEAAGTVGLAALEEKTALIAKAAQGRISNEPSGVSDAGTSSCHAYEFDRANGRYRDVELGSGDAVTDKRITNDADEAAQLLRWLRSIGVAE